VCREKRERRLCTTQGERERERWNDKFVHDIRRAELIASLVHDIRREEMICIDYFLGTQDFAYERGRDEAAARGLAAVGKLTEIVEVENETWQGAKFGVC